MTVGVVGPGLDVASGSDRPLKVSGVRGLSVHRHVRTQVDYEVGKVVVTSVADVSGRNPRLPLSFCGRE